MDSRYIDFAKTDAEKLAINAVISEGSQRKAAKALGKSKSTISDAVSRVKRRASLQGFSPENDMYHIAPDTHHVKGTSTLYKDGKVSLQWVKTDKKLEDQYKVMKECFEAMKDDLPKHSTVPSSKKDKRDDLVNMYAVTDYHYGMMAWSEETRGDDWDMSIAENTIINWFKSAIEQSPCSKTGILAQIGDLLHWDGLEAVTPSHGHVLDADTRFQKLIRSVIRVFRSIVDMLLEKHDHVHIIHAEGNHDLASSAWLREMFAVFYEDNPRVTVDQSADCYYCYEFGKTSLFFHHGHKRNVSNISTVFAAKFRDVFGRTEFSYGHMGHKHSKDVKENNLMIIEQHQTLAASDAYASAGGWMSQRSAQCITYHKEYGEVSRVRITPEMVA